MHRIDTLRRFTASMHSTWTILSAMVEVSVKNAFSIPEEYSYLSESCFNLELYNVTSRLTDEAQ